MTTEQLPEYWLRGPVAGVPDLLQPVAHALLQAQEEIHEMMGGFPEKRLWERPAGMASAGFHLRHLAGVLDRLFTYAKAEPLSRQQLAYLAEEGNPQEDITTPFLLMVLDAQIAKSVDQLRATDPQTLTQSRSVGRKQLPSTVMGLLFHAAEHTMRHTGQLLVTVKILGQE
ncbi:MAG: DinB family protein [Bacteroidetes bacterium]|nr:DinB family protein [Bacteroidota bacterium]